MKNLVNFIKKIVVIVAIYSVLIFGCIYSYSNINMKPIDEYKSLKNEELCGIFDFNNNYLKDGIYKFKVNVTVFLLNKEYKVSWYDSFPYTITDDVLQNPPSACTDNTRYIILNLKLENNKTLEEMIGDNIVYIALFSILCFLLVVLTIIVLVNMDKL